MGRTFSSQDIAHMTALYQQKCAALGVFFSASTVALDARALSHHIAVARRLAARRLGDRAAYRYRDIAANTRMALAYMGKSIHLFGTEAIGPDLDLLRTSIRDYLTDLTAGDLIYLAGYHGLRHAHLAAEPDLVVWLDPTCGKPAKQAIQDAANHTFAQRYPDLVA